LASTFGAALFDADGNGWIDRVSSSFWYRNPGAFKGDSATEPKPFEACRYSDQQFLHDILTADIDKDNRLDIVTIQFDGIRWFHAPPPDSACSKWKEVLVNTGTSAPQQHGGIAIGDLDADGDLDISRIDRWFENKDGLGAEWVEHINIDFGLWDPSAYGLTGRALITDVNGDGHMDILQTECDLPNGRIAWFENVDGKGLHWTRHIIKDSTDRQDFHSLAYEDFDGDGDSDVFSAGGSHSDSLPKPYFWENVDGKGGSWKEHTLYNDSASVHDATAADMDGDGDIDVLAKNFLWGANYVFVNQSKPNSIRQNLNKSIQRMRSVPSHRDGKPGQAQRLAPLRGLPFKDQVHSSDGRALPMAK
jgi:hypothetical protein